MASCPAVLVPFVRACSGVGVCLDALSCACPDGLTGVSDWALGAPTCAISATAVTVMYSIFAVAELALLGFVGYFIFRLREASPTRKKRNSGLLYGALVLGSASFCFLALAVIRASAPVEPGNTIGTSAVVTVLFVAGTGLFWAYMLIFTRHILAIALNQLRVQTEEAKAHANHAIAVLRYGFPVILVIIEFFSLVPIFLLASLNPTTWYAIIFVHYEGLAFTCVFLAIYLFPVLMRHVIRDLDAAVTRGQAMGLDMAQLQTVQKKLKRVMVDVRNQALFNICFASPFGVLPGLQQIGTYWTPVAFTSAAAVSMVSLYLEMPVRNSKSSTLPKNSSQDSSRAKVAAEAGSDNPNGGTLNSSMVSRAPSLVE